VGEEATTTLRASATVPLTTVAAAVAEDQGTASSEKRWDFNLSASSKEGLGIEVKVRDLF